MSEPKQLDQVYLHSRQEAFVILALWLACFAWTVPYCYLYGYRTPNEPYELSIAFGLPAWVVWGVAVPWLVTGIIAVLFCVFFFKEDELGHAADEHKASSETEEV